MPGINYLSELDRINAKKALGPVVADMTERELRVALLYVLHGIEIYEAIDSARGFRGVDSPMVPLGREPPRKEEWTKEVKRGDRQ